MKDNVDKCVFISLWVQESPRINGIPLSGPKQQSARNVCVIYSTHKRVRVILTVNAGNTNEKYNLALGNLLAKRR